VYDTCFHARQSFRVSLLHSRQSASFVVVVVVGRRASTKKESAGSRSFRLGRRGLAVERTSLVVRFRSVRFFHSFPGVETKTARMGATDGSRLSVAPGLDVTGPHYRTLCRMMSKRARLWTEMAHHDAVTRNASNTMRRAEALCTAQLGGSDPGELAKAAVVCADEYGYDEVNLNCGCPSERVCGKGESEKCFGAAMMLDAELTAECARRMAEAVDAKVTIKHRLGVRYDKTMTKEEDTDCYDYVVDFVDKIKEASGVDHFIVHARCAVMGGLNPDANRKVPPLRYDEVFALCDDFAKTDFTLNGGVNSVTHAKELLDREGGKLAGVMMGRAFYKHPCLLADVDRLIFGEEQRVPPHTRRSVIREYGEYGDRAYAEKGGDDFFDAKSRKQWARKLFKSIDGITYGTSVGGRTFRKAADALLDTHYPLDAETPPFVPFSAHIARCAEHIPSEFLDAPLVDVNPEGDLTRQDGKAVSEQITAQLTSLSVRA